MPAALSSCCLLLLLTVFLQAQDKTFLPDHLTAESLHKYIADAVPNGELPKELEKYPLHPKGKEGSIQIVEGRKKTKSKVTVTSKISLNEFLIYELKDEIGKLIQTDIIRFHFGSKLYHRWQLLNDEKKSIRVLVGKSSPPTFTADLIKDANAGPVLDIIWHEAASPFNTPSVEKRIIRESRSFLGKVGLCWDETIYVDNKETRFIRINIPGERPGTDLGMADLPEKEERKNEPGLFSRLFGNKDKTPKQPESFTFKDKNFTFKHPGGSFIKVDAEKINPDATLLFTRARPSGSLTIIAEVAGEELNLTVDALYHLSKGRMDRLLKNPVYRDKKVVEINGLSFTTYSATGQMGLAPIAFTSFLLAHNGFLYQIINIEKGGTMNDSYTSTAKLVEGFKLIDPSRKATSVGTPSEPFSLPAYGIHFSPAEKGGTNWSKEELQIQFPLASYGTIFGGTNGVFLITADLQDLEVSDDALARTLLINAGFNYETEIESKKPHQQGTASGHEYGTVWKDQGETFTYRFRVLKNDSVACLISGFVPGTAEEAIEKLSGMMDLVKFTTPLDRSERLKQEKIREHDHQIINHIGLYHYGKAQMAKAREYFEKAHQLVPENPVYLNNIINTFIELNDPDGALAHLENSDVANETNAIKAIKAGLYFEQGSFQKARDLYREIFKENYRNEDELLRFLNLLGQLNEYDEAVTVIDRHLEKHGKTPLRPRRWQHQVYAQAGKTKEALAMAKALAEEFPENPTTKFDLIQAYLDNSQEKEALPLIASALEKQPNDPHLHYQKGLALNGEKQFQKAKESLEQALKLSPNNPLYSEALAFTSAMMGQGDQLSIREPLEPIKIPESLTSTLSNLPASTDTTGFSSITEKVVTGYHFEKDKPFRKTEYRTIKILNQAGVNDYKSIRFSFDPTYQRAYINELKTLDENGKVIAEAKLSEAYVSDNSAQIGAMATTESTVTAPVPGLRPGCSIQYSYTIEDKISAESFPFEYTFFAAFNPSGPRAVFVTGDIDHVLSKAPLGSLESLSGDQFKAWYHPAPPRYYNESSLPPLHRYLPSMALGHNQETWTKIASTYLKDINDRLQSSEQIKELAESLTKDLKTPEEKASAIVKHVKKNLSYQALEFGSRARIPNSAETILGNNYGDCKDHSLLAYQLFEAVGIPAALALVHNDNPIIPEFPSLDQFNHMILFAPTIRGGTFFDATNKESNTTDLAPIHLAGQLALVISKEESTLQKIPEDIKSINLLKSDRHIKALPEENKFLIEETLSFQGGYTSGIRSYLRNSNSAEHKSNLEAMLGSRLDLSIDKLDLENLNEVDKPFTIKMTYTIRQEFDKDGGSLIASIPALWDRFYFDQNRSGQRKSPFYFNSDFSFASDTKLTLPDSFSFSKPTWTNFSESSPSFETTLKADESGNHYQHTLTLRKGIHPKEEHAKYTRGMARTLKNLESSLICKKKSP